MKEIIYNIFLSIISLLSLIAVSSCTDKNDWETDSAYDRLFRVTKLSVKEAKITADVEWTSTPNTEKYILEVSKDSLYDAIEIGASNGSIVYGEDEAITKSPYTLTGLDSSTKYYIRMKGVSESKESRWAYLESFYFTTKGEQIMLAVNPSEKTDKSVILRWNAEGAPVSHIILAYTENGLPQEKRVDLTDNDNTNSYVSINDLQESTTYITSIYNGENKRGEISFRTNETIPQEGVIRWLEGSEDIVAYLDTVTATNLTLVLPAESVYETSWLNESNEAQTTLRLPEVVTSLTLWGASGNSQAVINSTSVKLSAGTTKLKFKNVELRGKSSASDYVINESVTSPISEVIFDDCSINTFRGVFRIQNSANTSNISTLTFTDCIIHTIEGYGIVNGADKVTFGDITIQNCTFYNLKEVFIVMKSKANSIILNSCTFYNAIKSGKYYFDFKNGDINCTPDSFRIENCIFGKNYNLKDGETVRATNPGDKATQFLFNSYLTSDCVLNSGYPFVGSIAYENTSYQLFTDPDNGVFSIKDSGFSGKDSAGDPRWRQ